jgi:hypothetical protein
MTRDEADQVERAVTQAASLVVDGEAGIAVEVLTDLAAWARTAAADTDEWTRLHHALYGLKSA